MRNASTATFTTPGSVVIIRTRNSAQTKNKADTQAIKIALYFAVFQTDFSARSGWPAPRFWPTNVAAALLKPKAGKIKNTIHLIAMVYPATASLPKSVIMRAIAIQLAEPIKNCKVAVDATFRRFFITSLSGKK